MSEISNKFKVKKGLDVVGDTSMNGRLDVTGPITTPNLPQTDNSTNVANTNYVRTAVSNLINAAPGALDTLKELADAIGDDANFASTMTTALALKAPLDSPVLTGTPKAVTTAAGDNSTNIATTAYVDRADNLKAPIASPDLSGTPLSVTAPADTNTRQIATTAFVLGQAGTLTPIMAGIAAIGTSYRYARQDHVHPSDTTKANLSGASFTGAISTSSYLAVTGGDIRLSGAWVVKNLTDNLYLQSDTVGKDVVIRTSGSTERMRVKDSGNVLIGTTTDNTTDKLQVSGTISATKFKGSADLAAGSTIPTATAGDNSTQIANTSFVTNAIASNNTSPSFGGNTTFVGGIGTSDFHIIQFPGGARFNATTGQNSLTGSFKIALPVLYNSSMVRMTIKVFEYVTGKAFDLIVSGYNDNASTTWVQTSAYMIGDTASKTPNVRFGNDGTKTCIWIGDLTDTWAFPQIYVTDVQVGYTGSSNTWLSGWAVSLVSTFDTVKVGPTVPTRMSQLVSPAFTGTPTVPNVAAKDNSGKIANTAYVDAADGLKADLASPIFSGTPQVPTATVGDSSLQIANTQFVSTAVANLVAAAPTTLNTLKELADAIGDDANFSTTMTNNLATKAPLASPSFTGSGTIVGSFTAGSSVIGTNNVIIRGGGTGAEGGQVVLGYGNNLATSISGQANSTWNIDVDGTSNFRVFNQNASGVTTVAMQIDDPTASVALKNSPTAPTPIAGDNTTHIATGAYVQKEFSTSLSKAITGGTVVLTAAEAVVRILILTGTLTSNAIIQVPTGNGRWIIDNRTTGSFTLSVKMSAGTGVTVAQNQRQEVYSDGSNVYSVQTDFSNVGVLTATAVISSNITVMQGNITDTINGSPWYGIGGSNVVGWTAGKNMVQVAGFYGIKLKTNAVTVDIEGTKGAGTIDITSTAITTSGTLTATGNITAPTFIGNLTGNASGTAANVTGTVAVGNGGTGVTTISGLVFGNGTSAFTAATAAQISSALGTTNISGNAANVTGTVAVGNGGTGATTISGLVYGNGTSAMTAATGAQIATALGSNAVTTANNLKITTDNATATALYPWFGGSSGASVGGYNSNNLSFVPSTGTLTVSGNYMVGTNTVWHAGNLTNVSQLTNDANYMVAPGGAIQISGGGTGATTASGALTNLGAAPIASPTFTGTATAPNMTVNTNLIVGNQISKKGGTSVQYAILFSPTSGTFTLDYQSAGNYRTLKYLVQIKDTTNNIYEATELLVVTNGTVANLTQYGNIFTGTASLGSFDVSLSGGMLSLVWTPVSGTTSYTITADVTAMAA